MTQTAQGKMISGLILVVLGVLLFILKLLDRFDYELVPLLRGGLLLAVYFRRRSYGLLIPACILLGIGLGSLAEVANLQRIDVNSLGLGLGFLAIYKLHLSYAKKDRKWPLIPGFLFLAHGFAGLVGQFNHWFVVGWPLVLVIIGILILIGTFERSSS